MEKLLSIIIPVYNVGERLRLQLDSISKQTYCNFECILINDGSTDNSEFICREYVARDSRFILHSQENKGVSAARNYGLDHAQGEYIAFADADDIVEPRMYELLMDAAEKYAVDVASCSQSTDIIYTPNDTNKNWDFRYINNPIQEYYNDNTGGMKSKVYSKSIIKDIRFDEEISYNEDMLFVMQVYSKLDRLVMCDARLYHYMDYESDGVRLTQRKGDYKYWSGLVKANKKMKAIMESTGNENLIKRAWDKYGRAIFALFRLAIQLRDKDKYIIFKCEYKADIEKFLRISDENIIKKLVFTTYYYNYFIASLFHYYLKVKRN